MSPARKAALSSLIAVEKEGRYSNLELCAKLNREKLSEADRRLYTTLFYGVLERLITLDYFIERFCTRKKGALSPYLRNTLRLGFYQLLFLDSIPARAVLFETAELAKEREGQRAADLTTAVLRAFLRFVQTGADAFTALPTEEQRPARYSLPNWMLSLWDNAYGKEQCEKIAEAFLVSSQPCLHVNTLKSSTQALEALLTENGIETEEADSRSLFLKNPCGDIRALPGFSEGLFFVQDPASAAAVRALHCKEGEIVYDVCAAPGGKSFAVAMDLGVNGKIFAFDLHENKLSLIQDGAKRLGISEITTAVHDARKPFEAEQIADAVICDVPCSGLGVLAKKPDLRAKLREDIAGLPELQAAILTNAARLVKPGGRLLYSTCTLNPSENEEVTHAFLATNSDFCRADGEFPHTRFPIAGRCDGFFHDLLLRKDNA